MFISLCFCFYFFGTYSVIAFILCNYNNLLYVCEFMSSKLCLYQIFSLFLWYKQTDKGRIEVRISISLAFLFKHSKYFQSLLTTLHIYHYNLNQVTIINHKKYYKSPNWCLFLMVRFSPNFSLFSSQSNLPKPTTVISLVLFIKQSNGFPINQNKDLAFGHISNIISPQTTFIVLTSSFTKLLSLTKFYLVFIYQAPLNNHLCPKRWDTVINEALSLPLRKLQND